MANTEKIMCIRCFGTRRPFGMIEVRTDIGTKTQKIKCHVCGHVTRNRVFKTKIKKCWYAEDNKEG